MYEQGGDDGEEEEGVWGYGEEGRAFNGIGFGQLGAVFEDVFGEGVPFLVGLEAQVDVC